MSVTTIVGGSRGLTGGQMSGHEWRQFKTTQNSLTFSIVTLLQYVNANFCAYNMRRNFGICCFKAVAFTTKIYTVAVTYSL